MNTESWNQTDSRPVPMDFSEEERARLDRGEMLTSTVPLPGSSTPALRLTAVLDCPGHRLWRLMTEYEQLPHSMYGLETAQVLESSPDSDLVRFSMKLPFPLGRIRWTSNVHKQQHGDHYFASWDLQDGDLSECDGQLRIRPYQGNPRRALAEYQIRIATKLRVPSSAEKLATRWLLPRLVGRLRKLATNGT